MLFGQESVFTGLRSELKKADKYFENQSFNQALRHYLAVEKSKKASEDIALKIARTYYQLLDNKNAVTWFTDYIHSHGSLPAEDELTYAESLSGIESYKEAIVWYEKYQARNPSDQKITEKIWRLRNIEYLYEDSAYYMVRSVAFNSPASAFGPAYFKEGFVFVSNQRTGSPVQRIDGATNAPFYTLYYTKQFIDTISNTITYSKPVEFGKGLDSKFHKGTVAFFPGEEKMIYTKSVAVPGNAASTLQLIFARYIDEAWIEVEGFPYNSPRYSVSHPALTADGKTLYFASDMPGGFGSKDLYKSVLQDDGWTKPENLGPTINTPGEETFPFYHHSGILYFASNGHGGFGGLDIFKVKLQGRKFGNVQNLGYPVNTGYDDFGMVLNAEGTQGFISSNRKRGQLDDDIFELEVDLQTYPLVIKGTLRYRTADMHDSSDLMLLPNATLSLIDNNTNKEVSKTVSDSSGCFVLEIPYSSQYKVEVTEKSVGQEIVSLEIPRNKKRHTNHEIVIIKDRFEESVPRTRPDPSPIKKIK